MSNKEALPRWTHAAFEGTKFHFDSTDTKANLWVEFCHQCRKKNIPLGAYPMHFCGFLDSKAAESVPPVSKSTYNRKSNHNTYPPAQKERERPPKQSSITLLEEKIANFKFSDDEHQFTGTEAVEDLLSLDDSTVIARVIEFTAVVECPHCSNVSTIDKETYDAHQYQCGSCKALITISW